MKAFATRPRPALLVLATWIAAPCAADVTITYVGNDGVLLDAGGQTVLIDSLFTHSDNFWTHLSGQPRLDFFAALAPFDDVRWSLTTHNHPDHHATAAVNVFSGASPQTQFLLPPQARGSLGGNAQVLDFTAPFQTGSTTFTSPGIEIEVFHMEHFDQFGNDFSSVQDYTYLVTMGGVKVLHLGDVDYIPENFLAYDFPSRDVDVVIIPTFNTLISEANRDLILQYVAPEHIIATHLRAGQLVSEEANVRAVYPNASIFTQPLVDAITVRGVPEPAAWAIALVGAMGLVWRR